MLPLFLWIPARRNGTGWVWIIFWGQIDVQTVFPMHFWGDYSVITRYQEEQPQYASRVIPLSREGYEVVM